MQRHRRAETPGTAGAGWPAGGVANLECQVEGPALLAPPFSGGNGEPWLGFLWARP